MPKENIVEFYKQLASDNALNQKLQAAVSLNAEALAKIANESGYDFTPEELIEYINEMNETKNKKLTDDELDAVSGAGIFGIDLCPKTFNDFLCRFSRCPHIRWRAEIKVKEDSINIHNDSETETDYIYCDLGYWDQKNGL